MTPGGDGVTPSSRDQDRDRDRETGSGSVGKVGIGASHNGHDDR